MQINLEQGDTHSIQAYSDEGLKINDTWYTENVIINRESIITEWAAKNIHSIAQPEMDPLLILNPEILLIGHQETGRFLKPRLIAELGQKRIGLESMSVNAACRTFNVLLSEGRNVVLGIIWGICHD